MCQRYGAPRGADCQTWAAQWMGHAGSSSPLSQPRPGEGTLCSHAPAAGKTRGLNTPGLDYTTRSSCNHKMWLPKWYSVRCGKEESCILNLLQGGKSVRLNRRIFTCPTASERSNADLFVVAWHHNTHDQVWPRWITWYRVLSHFKVVWNHIFRHLMMFCRKSKLCPVRFGGKEGMTKAEISWIRLLWCASKLKL